MAEWLSNEPLHSERHDIRISGMSWALCIKQDDC